MNAPANVPPEHPDPGGEAAARAAQLAAMVVSVAEAAARLQAHRQSAAHVAAEQDAAARRAIAAADAAQARVVYGAALDDAWRRQASTSELLDSWAAAGPYLASGPLGTDPLAGLATERVEERLRQLHPEAMAAFDAARSVGFPREDCLDVAAMLWRGEYGLDPIGTPVARQLADLEHGRAAVQRDTDDVLVTTDVDEAAAGLAASNGTDGHAARQTALAQLPAGPLPAAQLPTAQLPTAQLPAGRIPGGSDPRVVVGQAFPVDIRTAMATAPRAAKERLAIGPGPQRRQLTAAPNTPHKPNHPNASRSLQ